MIGPKMRLDKCEVDEYKRVNFSGKGRGESVQLTED